MTRKEPPRLWLASILLLALAALVGCGKALTESSAAKVIQVYIDSQGGGIVQTSISSLAGRIGVESQPPPEELPAGMRRLLEQGIIQQKTTSVVYPNFSGAFSGSHSEGFTGIVKDTLNIQTTAGKPPQVNGTYRQCTGAPAPPQYPDGVCSTESVNGIIERQGPTHLALMPTQQALMQPPMPRRLHLTLQRGTPDVLQGTFDVGMYILVNGQNQSSAPFRVQGVVTGPDIEQKLYSYTWTDKLPKDVVSGWDLKLGHAVVDSCEHLLLTTETTATATCKTHVKITNGAEIIFGNRPTDQTLQAVFGKQPDGSWIGTRIENYSPPKYDIGQ